jgi:hypothetical protein
LAELTRYCQRAIIYAMTKLEKYKFIIRHRRIKWWRTRFGRRVVQDSNSYEYRLPEMTSRGQLSAMSVFVKSLSEPSGCTGIRENSLQFIREEDRETNATPRQTPDDRVDKKRK